MSKYFLVVIDKESGASLYLGREKSLYDIEEKTKLSLKEIKDILNEKVVNPYYRIQRIKNTITKIKNKTLRDKALENYFD